MAKAKQIQLQTDITTEDEWDRFLQRDGLLVVDIYSEWCGPCTAMQGNLKKIKLESGGDFLQLGMARCDNIESLKRFRYKSEPTWMFIAKGQQVNLLFGSNAPQVQRVILDEMRKEKECLAGTRQRKQLFPYDFSDDEQVIHNQLQQKEMERERIKVEKIYKQLKDRRIAQAKNILDTMAHLGLIVIFPQAIKKSLEVLEEFLPDSGIAISKKERPQLTLEAMEDIEFLSTHKLPEGMKNHLVSDKCFALMLTVDQEINPGPLDDTILKFVYGSTKTPPGEPGTPGYALLKSQINKKVEEPLPEPAPELYESMEKMAALEMQEGEDGEAEEEDASHFEAANVPSIPSVNLPPDDDELQAEEEEVEEEEEEEELDLWGIWAPPNEFVKATALKYCFPLITSVLILPEQPPTPPHVAIAFEVFKRHNVFKLMDEYPAEIMAYGFFTSDQPDEARVIAKSKKQYEIQFTGQQAVGEKLILKVAKRKSDPILAFAQLGPTYMSSNVDVGEQDCLTFFPENYEEETEGVTKARSTLLAPIQQIPAEEVTTEDLFMVEEEDMVFDSVLDGEEEDIGEIGGDVEVIPPMEMTELPQVEEESEYGQTQDYE